MIDNKIFPDSFDRYRGDRWNCIGEPLRRRPREQHLRGKIEASGNSNL